MLTVSLFGIWNNALFCLDLTKVLKSINILTKALVGHGPRIPPGPITGSKNGMTQATQMADSGAW